MPWLVRPPAARQSGTSKAPRGRPASRGRVGRAAPPRHYSAAGRRPFFAAVPAPAARLWHCYGGSRDDGVAAGAGDGRRVFGRGWGGRQCVLRADSPPSDCRWSSAGTSALRSPASRAGVPRHSGHTAPVTPRRASHPVTADNRRVSAIKGAAAAARQPARGQPCAAGTARHGSTKLNQGQGQFSPVLGVNLVGHLPAGQWRWAGSEIAARRTQVPRARRFCRGRP